MYTCRTGGGMKLDFWKNSASRPDVRAVHGSLETARWSIHRDPLTQQTDRCTGSLVFIVWWLVVLTGLLKIFEDQFLLIDKLAGMVIRIIGANIP